MADSKQVELTAYLNINSAQLSIAINCIRKVSDVRIIGI